MKKTTLFVIALLAGAYLHAQRITVTIAGNTAGYSGDGNWSINSNINGPKDVCVDAANNVYFTDHNNGLVRKISHVDGIVTTIAGGGSSLADGVPATAASLTPNYLCISSSSLYITTGNQIRKLNLTSGIISTVAGSATAAGYTGDGSAAALALLNAPTGICIDASGNLYFVDRNNNAVRKITATGGIISTIAGGNIAPSYTGDGAAATAATLASPACICVDATGNVFFSDQEPNYPSNFSYSVMREIAAGSGVISTIAGTTGSSAIYGVPATAAELGTITGMCCDGHGNIYCCEMSCSCRELNMSNDTLYLVGGNFGIEGFANGLSSPVAYMSYPMGICADNANNVYIADSANNRIRKLISLTNTPTFVFGTGEYISTPPGPGVSIPLASMLTVVDMDATVTETWTVSTPPIYGTLSGFPASALSGGLNNDTMATGSLVYYPPNYNTVDQFTILVSDGAGNSSTVTVYVGVGVSSVALSVANVSNTAGVNIFPNPASSVLNVAWNGLQPQGNNIAISDIADRMVYSGTLGAASGTTQVDISALPTGMYFMRVNGGDVKKFVKE